MVTTMTKPEWLFLDLDGTIVTHAYELPDKTVEIIHKLKAHVPISIATGRSFKSSELFLNKLNITESCLFQNGAMVKNPVTSERRLIKSINLEIAREVISLAYDFGISFKLHTRDERIIKSDHLDWEDEIVYDTAVCNKRDMLDLVDEEPIKFIFFGTGRMPEFEKALRELTYIDDKHIRFFQSHRYYWEITHFDVSKGYTIKLLTEEAGRSPEGIIGVGDHDNDLEMLRYVGIPICVDTASENAGKLAKIKIPGPESSGIASLLDMFEQGCFYSPSSDNA